MTSPDWPVRDWPKLPASNLYFDLKAMNHEEAFVLAFVVAARRARYLEFLRSPKRRLEILRRLNHCFDFEPALATPVSRNFDLALLLRNRGAGNSAHVIGGKDGLDGKDLPLEEAVNSATADPNGIVISCIPGRLALYMQEFPPGDVFVLGLKS